MDKIQKQAKALQKQLKGLQRQLKELRLPNSQDIKDQIDSIIKAAATSDGAQGAMDALGDFTSSYLVPLVNRVNPDGAQRLQDSLDDIQKQFEALQKKQHTAVKVGRSTMSALVYDKKSPMGVKLVEGVTIPKPGSEQVLVRVTAAALNHRDYEKQKQQIPLIANLDGRGVGIDFCGVVEELGWWKGDRVHMFSVAVGERIFGVAKGTIAEYVLVDAASIARAPRGISNEEAAALPLCGVTAYEALKQGNMTKGMNVAVVGATGGIGNIVVQIAKSMGASEVIGLASPEHAEAATSVGATQVVDYNELPLSGQIAAESVDLVIYCYNAASREKYESEFKPLLKENGKFVALSAAPIDRARKSFTETTGFNFQRGGFSLVTNDVKREGLELLAEWYDDGQLKPLIDSVIPFSNEAIEEGLAKLKTAHVMGKIIVGIADK